MQLRRRWERMRISCAPCPLVQSGQQLKVGPKVVARYGTHGVMTKEVQDGQGKFPVVWGQWYWISLKSASVDNT